MSVPACRQTDTESPGQAISLHTGESPTNQNGVSDTGNSVNKKRPSEMEWVKFTKQESLPRILGHFYLGGFTLCIYCRKLSSLNWPLIILTATTVAGEDYEAMLGLCAGPGEGSTPSLSSPQLEEPSALARALTKARGRGWGGEISIRSVRLLQALLLLLPTVAPTKSRWRVSAEGSGLFWYRCIVNGSRACWREPKVSHNSVHLGSAVRTAASAQQPRPCCLRCLAILAREIKGI